jgi:hypothetical protein
MALVFLPKLHAEYTKFEYRVFDTTIRSNITQGPSQRYGYCRRGGGCLR